VADTGTSVEATLKRDALTDKERQRLVKLMDRAQAGDKKALDEARPLLDRTDLWKYMGGLSGRVQDAWLDAITGKNRLVREAYQRQSDELRRELLAAGDSALERLLVERVVATWLQVCHADSVYAAMLKADGHSFALGTYYQRRQESANARHLKAVKALATVRRLLVPAVQVNIGRNQVIAQGGQPATPTDEYSKASTPILEGTAETVRA
jgi:hypothetical protein